MTALRWIQTGSPFLEWTAYDSAGNEAGFVSSQDGGQSWQGQSIDGTTKDFFSKEAAENWIEDPEHPIIEPC